MTLSVFLNQNAIAAKEADELEEALMVKLLEKRAKKRTDDDTGSVRLEKSDLKFLKGDDKSEISVAVVNDVKGLLKEPMLTLLASSELISWAELNERVVAAKKALEVFEVKYRTELSSGGKSAPATALATMPGANKMVAAMPGAKVAVMPGVQAAAGKVVAKKMADDDDDDEEDDDPKAKQKPVAASMPGVATKPSGMPGIQTKPTGGMPGVAAAPAGMPVAGSVGGGMSGVAPTPIAAPTGMPGVAAPVVAGGMPGVAPAAGGMPMAK